MGAAQEKHRYRITLRGIKLEKQIAGYKDILAGLDTRHSIDDMHYAETLRADIDAMEARLHRLAWGNQ